MSDKLFPEALFEQGYTDLVSVIPPGAQLAPTSKISQSQLGKTPGVRLASGLWVGYNWRADEPTVEHVRRWAIGGANVGLRADRFPAIDIDCMDERLASIIENAAYDKLGAAPVRIGRAPKRLMMYRTDEPFGRMRLWFAHKGEQYLVEVLGQGQQYLVHGTHPSTLRPYEWVTDVLAVPADKLPTITREQADAFLGYLADMLGGTLGLDNVTREGDGRPLSRSNVDQDELLAPSFDALAECVACIPNTNELFPDRTSYLKMGYAIRAAAGSSDEDDAFALFADWAAKWEGNDRSDGNDPDVVLADWRRMNGTRQVGWSWLAEQARPFGYNYAVEEFEVLSERPDDDAPVQAPLYSEQWLADRIVRRRGERLRYLPQTGRFLVRNGAHWKVDGEMLAEDLIKRELRAVADYVARQGSTPKEQRENQALASTLCSAKKAANVRTLLQSERAIAVSVSALDHDPWALCTPAGIINLRNGKLGQADPDALCTHSTSVPADFGGACPEWRRFLAEATGGDRELENYLQRLAGYCLTGSTREQQFVFMWGPGGNGKSLFLNAISGVLGDYARVAPMDTFTASHNERHTTDIASLMGARLVTASETQSGKRWDEARVKSLTGGEPVTARFMRQDNFTFTPQFKLVIAGNHKPAVRDVDAAIRRRLHMVPFTATPARVDTELGAKLREEWPAILAWMIEGCLAWQRDGLQPPTTVVGATNEYFMEEDAVGRWLNDCCDIDGDATELSSDLYASWREWASENGEYVGSMKRFSSALVARRIERWRDPKTRRMGFAGLRIRDKQVFGILSE